MRAKPVTAHVSVVQPRASLMTLGLVAICPLMPLIIPSLAFSNSSHAAVLAVQQVEYATGSRPVHLRPNTFPLFQARFWQGITWVREHRARIAERCHIATVRVAVYRLYQIVSARGASCLCMYMSDSEATTREHEKRERGGDPHSDAAIMSAESRKPRSKTLVRSKFFFAEAVAFRSWGTQRQKMKRFAAPALSATPAIIRLPNAVVMMIAAFFNQKDFACASSTCREWRRLGAGWLFHVHLPHPMLRRNQVVLEALGDFFHLRAAQFLSMVIRPEHTSCVYGPVSDPAVSFLFI